MRELAIAVQNGNESVNVINTINSIKNANFKNVFVQWYDKDWEYSQQEQVNLCKKLGLNIIFAHLGYQNINLIWNDYYSNISLDEFYKVGYERGMKLAEIIK